jgi:hypothetical protein
MELRYLRSHLTGTTSATTCNVLMVTNTLCRAHTHQIATEMLLGRLESCRQNIAIPSRYSSTVKQSKHRVTGIGPSEIARVVGPGGDNLVRNDGITEVEKAERSPLPRTRVLLSCHWEIHRLGEAVKQPSFIALSRMSNFPDILFTSKVKVLVSVNIFDLVSSRYSYTLPKTSYGIRL